MSSYQNATAFRDGLQARPSDVFIAVMGVTGSGKSSFISRCCEKNIAIGHNLQACTTTVDVYPCKINAMTTVFLIDTPGFDDTNRSDTEVLKELASWLTDSYMANIRLSGIIYLHRISDVRMQGSAKKNLFMFKKLCGPNALKNVILATTMWDRISEAEGATREQELVSTADFWGWMVSRGSRVYRHAGDKASASKLIQNLMSDNAHITLELQQQMVNEKKNLHETDAGLELQAEIAKERQKFQKSLIEIQQQMKEALQARDEDSIQAMQELQEDYNIRLLQLQKANEELKIGMERLHEEKYRKIEAFMTAQEADHMAEVRRLESALATLKVKDQYEPQYKANPAKKRGICHDLSNDHITLCVNGYSFYFKGPKHHLGYWGPSSKFLNEYYILALGEQDTWVATDANGTTEWSDNVPTVYPWFVHDWNAERYGLVDYISLGTNGNYYVRGTKSRGWSWFNYDMREHVNMDTNASLINVCAFGKGGSYVVTLSDGRVYWDLKGKYSKLEASLQRNQNWGISEIKALALSLTNDWEYLVVYVNGDVEVSTSEETRPHWEWWCTANFGTLFE